MKRREIPEGYVSSFASHTDPAQSQPPPLIIQQKQAETLMGHSLKELIKERLYGSIVNYSRAHNHKKSYYTPSISPTQDPSTLIAKSTSSIPDHKSSRVSQFRTNLQKRIYSRYDSVVRKTSHTIKEEKEANCNSFADIEESLISRSNRHKKNRSAFSSKNDWDSNQRSLEQETQKYKYSSFLSSIEEDEGHRGGTTRKKSYKLSPILKKKHFDEKPEKINCTIKSPILARLEMHKFEIDLSFWEKLCKKQKQRYENQLQQAIISQTLIKDQPIAIDSKTFNAHSVPSTKSNHNLFSSLVSADKSKFLLSKSIFSKEQFQDYLGNSKQVVINLAKHLLSFFELNGKIYDQMKIEDYKRCMEIMVTAGPRVWAVCAFRFWDVDQNGLICTNDIFKIFKDLDQLENDLKQNNDDPNPKSLRMVIQLKKSVQKLQQLVLAQSLNEKLMMSVPSQLEPIFEIKYLQESVLRRKELRYSDLLLILGQHIKNTVKESKRSVIQTTKQISIKMSSCYRYSFLATDHNEQTREDRDQIQMLKESLKNDKMEMKEKDRENQLINKKLRGIEYSNFVEEKMYQIVREIALAIFGIQGQ